MLVLVGELYRELGELDAARPLLEEALELAEASGEVEARVAALSALAELDMEDGNHDRALTALESAEGLLQRAEMVPGVQHGALMTPLLFTLAETGRTAEAAEHGQAMLALARSHPDLPAGALYDYLVNTAIATSVAGQKDVAENLLREAHRLDFDRADDPTIRLTFHSQLASVLAEKGDLTAAVEHLRRAVAIAEEIYPPGHSTRARQLSNLGSVLNPLGRHQEAESALREALAIYESIYGEAPHPRVAAAHNNLGSALQRAGRYAVAELHLARARQLAAELFGVDDPRYAIATANLGDLQRRLGNYTFAEALLVEGLNLRRSIFGSDHQAVGAGLALLAALRLDQDRPAQALELADEALELFHRVDYDNPRWLITTMTRRARALAGLGRDDDAQAAFDEALSLGEKAGVDAGTAWPEVLAARAEFLVERQDPGAQEALERALNEHRTALGEDHPETARLEELSAAAGDP